MPNIVFNYHIPDVSCSSCRDTILSYVKEQREKNPNLLLISYDLILSEKRLELELDENTPYDIHGVMNLLDVESIGFSCTPQEPERSTKSLQWGNVHTWGAFLGFGLGFLLMLSSLGMFGLPLALIVLSNMALLSIAWPFVNKAWRHFYLSWEHQKYQNLLNMDSLFVFTGLLIMTSSILSLWFPVFPMLLEAGFLIFGFRHLGCIVQAYLDEQVSPARSLVSLFKNQMFEVNGQHEPVCGKFLRPSQIFLAKKGQVLPVDGRVVRGSASFRDVLKAGSYLPLYDVQQGSKIEAGTEVIDGEVWVEVEQDLMNSRLARIDAAVLDIRDRQKPAAILLQAERWLQWFIPAMLLLAIVSGIWIGQVFGLALALKCVAAILVSACPCTLGFIIPMSLQMGAYKAKINELNFQNSEALQLAFESKIVVVDYNGTLTRGQHQIGDFQMTGSSLVDPFVCYAVIDEIETHMLKERPHHPIGQMVKAKAKAQRIVDKATKIDVFAFEDFGYGAKLRTPTGEWWFGNHQIFEKIGQVENVQEVETAPQRLYLLHQQQGARDVYCVGYLDVQDELRLGASDFIHDLRNKGKKIRICTGADQFTAKYISEALQINPEDIKSEQSPDDKAKYIQFLREIYPDDVIAMIGDGANDCEALAASDIKIWLKNDNQSPDFEAFMKGCANIVVESGNLLGISRGLEVANQTFMAIQQNLWMSFTYNLIMLMLACGAFLAFGFSLHPAVGVSVMILQSICLVLNNYRIAELPLENRSTLTAN